MRTPKSLLTAAFGLLFVGCANEEPAYFKPIR